jgi:hypothetical protein
MPDPPMPMTLGPNYNYNNDESVLPTLNDQDLMLTNEDHNELLAHNDTEAKAKVAANNEAYQTFVRGIQDLSRENNETLESTIAGNLRDANETLQNTSCDTNETVKKTLTRMVQHQGSVLQTKWLRLFCVVVEFKGGGE